MTAGYIVMPLASARVLTGWAGAIGLLAMLGAIVWMNAGQASGQEASGDA